MSTTISSFGSSCNPAPAGQAEVQEAEAGAISGEGLFANVEKPHAEFIKCVQQAVEQGQVCGGEALKGEAPGAPTLYDPIYTFSVNDMVELLSNVQSKIFDQLLGTAKEWVESTRIRLKANFEAQQKLINDWISKFQSAAKTDKIGKIFNWIGKGIAFAASCVGVVIGTAALLTAGPVAAPLFLFSLIGFASAGLSLGSALSQQFGGPELSIANLIRKVLGTFLIHACGMESKKAQHVCKIAGGLLALSVPLALFIEPSLTGDFLQSLFELSGMDKKTAGYIALGWNTVASIALGILFAVLTAGASLASSGSSAIGSVIKVVGSVVSGVAGVVSGGTQIIRGGLTIATAYTVRESEQIVAKKKELEVLMTRLKKAMEDGVEEMKKISQDVEACIRVVSDMLADAAKSIEQIRQNTSGRAV